jgi:MarR family transcriptional regulator, organic hydroperoxide resistance regulator
MAASKDETILEIMHCLRRIFKIMQDYSHDAPQIYGITGPQLWVINTISLNKDLLLRDLAERMYLHPSTITGLVNVLEAKGYLVRVRGTADRRVVRVQLTPRGKRLADKAPAHGKMTKGLRHLKKQELGLIQKSVRRLVTIVEG